MEKKKYAVLYRGTKVDEIEAATRWEASLQADMRGYNIVSINLVEMKPGMVFEEFEDEE